tara:strand:+ start:45467 stop:46054 length:588 start_codon:yes stop_codon:yes gene_type:complete
MMELRWDIILIGTSAGGMKALEAILPQIPQDFPIPIVIVQHMGPDSDNYLASLLNEKCQVNVTEAQDGEKILSGTAYLAPGGYHLLIENDKTLSLCVGEKINYSRPSIDVLFSSASDVFGEKTLAIILTGANKDGTEGAIHIREDGGTVIAQDPATAEVPTMPQAVVDAEAADHVLPLDEIAQFIVGKVLLYDRD